MADEHVMLNLNKYVLTADKLSAMPSADRALMIWCGHIHNELMTLFGLYRAVANTTHSCAIEREAKTTQELVVVKLIAGKLLEAWELLRTGFSGTCLSKKYVPMFDDISGTSFKNITRYFGSGSSLQTLRNSYAFHYTFNELINFPDGWDSAPDELTFYVGSVPAHTLFFISEAITNRSMFLQLGAGNLTEGVQIFWSDIKAINEDMLAVCQAIFNLIVREHIGSPAEIGSVRVGVLNPPPIRQPAVPFFVMPE